MSKKIVYFTRIFEPKNEAISKEIELLRKEVEGIVFCLHSFHNFKSLFIKKSSTLFSILSLFKPLKVFIKIYERKSKLNHVFGNANNNIFLNKLTKKTIITLITEEKITSETIENLKKTEMIIVESERQKIILKKHGINQNKIRLIYPGTKINSKKPLLIQGKFTIGFASSPMSKRYFERRGISLLFDIAKKRQKIQFILFWRGKTTNKIKRIIRKMKLKNIILIDKTLTETEITSKIDVMIAPYTTFEENKSCPNSIIESLANGKPVLVSEKIGISELIKKENAGVIFNTNTESLSESIDEIKNNYYKYQKNAISTAKKYFSKEKFILEYKQIYEELKVI